MALLPLIKKIVYMPANDCEETAKTVKLALSLSLSIHAI
jgi:hypothetical protein